MLVKFDDEKEKKKKRCKPPNSVVLVEKSFLPTFRLRGNKEEEGAKTDSPGLGRRAEGEAKEGTRKQRVSFGSRKDTEGLDDIDSLEIDTASLAESSVDGSDGDAGSKIFVVINVSGQVIFEQEFSSSLQVRAVMANIATKLSVERNTSLYNPATNVFLEHDR